MNELNAAIATLSLLADLVCKIMLSVLACVLINYVRNRAKQPTAITHTVTAPASTGGHVEPARSWPRETPEEISAPIVCGRCNFDVTTEPITTYRNSERLLVEVYRCGNCGSELELPV